MAMKYSGQEGLVTPALHVLIQITVDGESPAKIRHFLPNLPVHRILSRIIEHLPDQGGDELHLLLFHPSGRHGRVPIRSPLVTLGLLVRGTTFLFTIRPAAPRALSASSPLTLVRSDRSGSSDCLCLRRSSQSLQSQLPASTAAFRHDLLLVVSEFRLESLAEANRFGRNDVHERPALNPREQAFVQQGLCFFLRKDQSSSGAEGSCALWK